jgi:hypothetical protein
MYNPDEEWLDPISINVGYFSSLGGHLNTPIDINKFYRNNDEIVTEFFHCGEMHNFGNLTEAIIDIENISPLNYNASVTVNSFVISSNEWLRSICEETLLILHPDENFSNELYIGVQQSERKFIKVKEKTKVMTYKIPFDKIDHFANFELVEDVHSNISHNYQIALSFAGEDRKYVNEVAKELKDMGIRVFYDDYEKASLWGKDLYTHLDDIYKNKSKYCIIFLSKHYKEKLWTNHERESAQEKAFREHETYILPVKLDDTLIPGIRSTTGYLDGTKLSSHQVASLAYEKLYSRPFKRPDLTAIVASV